MSEKKVVFWPKLTDYIFSSPFTKIVFSPHLRLYFDLTHFMTHIGSCFNLAPFFKQLHTISTTCLIQVAHNQSPYAFTKPPLALGHLEPETIEKSDSLHIHETSPSIRSLGARDNRKVRLVTHSRNLPQHQVTWSRRQQKSQTRYAFTKPPLGLVLSSNSTARC